jgi:transcription elongation factor
MVTSSTKGRRLLMPPRKADTALWRLGDLAGCAWASAWLGTSRARGWSRWPGTPVYGAPYGEFENEKGTPADAAMIRAALAAASRM